MLDDGEDSLKGGEFGKKNSTEDDKATIGSLVTDIYKSLRDGSAFVPVMKCLEEALAADVSGGGTGGKAKL